MTESWGFSDMSVREATCFTVGFGLYTAGLCIGLRLGLTTGAWELAGMLFWPTAPVLFLPVFAAPFMFIAGLARLVVYAVDAMRDAFAERLLAEESSPSEIRQIKESDFDDFLAVLLGRRLKRGRVEDDDDYVTALQELDTEFPGMASEIR